MAQYDQTGGRLSVGGLATDIALVVGASLLLGAVAKIAVPFVPVPMTLQSLVVIGLGLALGAKRGTAAVLLYLAEGAVGFPVFAGTPERGIGLAYMAGPTGGYLVGYVPAAFTAGWFADRGWDRSVWKAAAAALIATILIYVPGLLWLGMIMGFDAKLLSAGLYPFIPGDLTKAAIAAIGCPTVVGPLKNVLGRSRNR